MKNSMSTVFGTKGTGKGADWYPRPQLERKNWTSLNGKWEYAVTGIGDVPSGNYDGTITVPFALETAAGGVGRILSPNERLHYRRFFEFSPHPGIRVMLNFEAVDWKCSVFVNNRKAGTHTGGYIPFSFDITELVKNGMNELCLSVTDPTDTYFQQRGKQKLTPRGIWYTPTSGIWQSVWLEEVPVNHIRNIQITPSKNLDSVNLSVQTDKTAECMITIAEAGRTVISKPGRTNETLGLGIENPRLWSPDDPFLYDIEITCGEDTVKSYFGMRSISLEKGPFGRDMVLLNGAPVFINGPLDQGYWPESGMTQPSDEAIAFDLGTMKDLGFNAVRKHIKVESRRWYYHADRLGLLVIQDMPNGGREMANYLRNIIGEPFDKERRDDDEVAYKASMRDTAESRDLFENELRQMIHHLRNHPSIIIWCPFNESWGQYDSVGIYDMVKELDSSRLVDHASGWFDQGSGDFRSVHTYKAKLESPPSDDGRAYLISEYGGYNLIDRDHLWRSDDTSGYTYFESGDELTDAYVSLVETQVIPLIEEGLTGVIYTQLSDVEIETNGFLTYDRKVMKMNPERVRSVHLALRRAFRDSTGLWKPTSREGV